MQSSNSNFARRKVAAELVHREERLAAASRRTKSREKAERKAWRFPGTKVSVGAVSVEREQQQLCMQQRRGQRNTCRGLEGESLRQHKAAAQQLQRGLAGRLEHAAYLSRSQVRVAAMQQLTQRAFKQQQPRADRTFDLPPRAAESLTEVCRAEAGGFLTSFFPPSRMSH
jgi:hypothetical protein